MGRLSSRIASCYRKDQRRLRNRLKQLHRENQDKSKNLSEQWADLEQSIAQSETKVQLRKDNCPKPSFADPLPVNERRDEIAEAMSNHQVVILCGETGSGKTTQLPKICLEMGRGSHGLIGHTQPRRIAARSVASRIASELNSEVGQTVGYKIRFTDRVAEDSYIKVMTDGILLAETQNDPLLDQYDTLIIDEAHERSLNIDFLLGYLKQLLPKRPDFKLIITSATIDPERFSKHFDDAPIIEVSGRTYPVEIRYQPLVEDEDEEKERDQIRSILDAVDELALEGPGDILVFLSGERDIRETAEALRKHHPEGTEILPLFARLSAEEQGRIFRSHQKRRIVLATNVAETSLTVPGIRYVVDTGQARISRYSYRTKVQRLPIEPISQASANQRAGRCGRVAPGICIRLYSEEDFQARPEFTEPEILRTNLASVILQMTALKLGDVEAFPFVEPPDSRFVKDGFKLLFELKAVDERHRLTDLGKRLARLPIDPRLGRMLLAAERNGSLNELLVIVAALSIQDPRERPLEHQQAADQKHMQFHDEESDFIAYLNLWKFYHEQARHLSVNKLRKLCKSHYLNFLRMREWHDIERQLANQIKEMGFKLNQTEADYGSIHRAILTGLVTQVGFKLEASEHKKPQEKKRKKLVEYLGVRSNRMAIFPGSGLAKKTPKWIMAAELVDTTRLYARIVAQIDPQWIEHIGSHLIKRNYYEPHWEQKPAQVIAYERQILYGLTINPKKRVHYGLIDPVVSRELFIRAALVLGELDLKADFFSANQQLVKEVEQLEAKARRRDLMVDPEQIYQFYDQRIPEEVHNAKTFLTWWNKVERDDPKLLHLQQQDLLQGSTDGIGSDAYPNHLSLDGLSYALDYQFEPGQPIDGITLVVPLAALNLISEDRLQWLVPGMLEDKVTQLIRSLPKSIRRSFVPAPDFAKASVESLVFADGLLTDSLAKQLRRMTGVTIPEDAWDQSNLPNHLVMNIRVLGNEGEVLGEDRDLAELKTRLGQKAKERFRSLTNKYEQKNQEEVYTDWTFADLPERQELEQGGLKVHGYPALVDREDEQGVVLQFFDLAEIAHAHHKKGCLRLIRNRLKQQISYLLKKSPLSQQACLRFSSIGNCNSLKQDLIEAALVRVFLKEPIRTQEEFESRIEEGKGLLVSEANEMGQRIEQVLQRYQQVIKSLKQFNDMAYIRLVADIKDQMSHLIYPGFITATPRPWLDYLSRYFEAVDRRLERIKINPKGDQQGVSQLEPYWRQFTENIKKQGKPDQWSEAFVHYRWMLEEFRVSLFAQPLKTSQPISAKRLDKQWQLVKKG